METEGKADKGKRTEYVSEEQALRQSLEDTDKVYDVKLFRDKSPKLPSPYPVWIISSDDPEVVKVLEAIAWGGDNNPPFSTIQEIFRGDAPILKYGIQLRLSETLEDTLKKLAEAEEG